MMSSIPQILLYCRFHPSCMGMTIEEAKKLEHFLCSDCSSDDDAKRSLNAFPVSPSVEAKVGTLALLCVYVLLFHFVYESLRSRSNFYSDNLIICIRWLVQ